MDISRRNSSSAQSRSGKASAHAPAPQDVDHGRRGLLAGAVAAGALSFPVAASLPDETQSQPDGSRSLTYRETEHIRQAYQRMRF